VVLVKARIRDLWRLAQANPVTVFAIGGAIAGVIVWWAIDDLRDDTNTIIRDVQIIQRSIDSKCDRASQPGASPEVRRECDRILRAARKRESVGAACVTLRKAGYRCPVGDVERRIEQRRGEDRQSSVNTDPATIPSPEGSPALSVPAAPDRPEPPDTSSPPPAPPAAPPAPAPPATAPPASPPVTSRPPTVQLPQVSVDLGSGNACVGVGGLAVGVC
jgi:hypothetical protein